MRILFFCPTPPPFHGSNYMAKLLIDSLSEREEFEVKHINVSFSKEIKELQKFTIKKAYLFVKYLFQLVFSILTFNPKYIIIIPAFQRNPFIINYIYVFISSIVFRQKVILWIHSNNIKHFYDNSGFIFKKAIRSIFSQSYLIVPCASKLTELNYNFFSDGKKVKPINNGILLNVIDKQIKMNSEIKITYLSNLHLAKGWKVLFDAAELICKNSKNVTFYFYGNPSNNSSIEMINNVFSNTQFKDRIKYLGPIYGEEKQSVLANTDIFCFPTFYPTEAFPLVILEAMANSTPVITTARGGIPEAVMNNEGGFIVPEKNVSELVDKIRILIDNEKLRINMGTFNKQKYLENFTFKHFVNNWLELFNSKIYEK